MTLSKRQEDNYMLGENICKPHILNLHPECDIHVYRYLYVYVHVT